MISSNRNTPSRWLRGQSGRAPAEGVKILPFAHAEALRPTIGALQRPDAGDRDPSGLSEPAPVVDHPKPPRIDKIELTIDSLQNYELLKPIQVIVESLGDKVLSLKRPN